MSENTIEVDNKLIIVKQLPVIVEKLKSLSDEIDNQINTALSMECTEDSVKEIKKIRADLNKKLTALEEQRKRVKSEVLEPYNQFEEVYKECVSDKFKSTDAKLKTKIDEVENSLKIQKENEVKEYFKEYLASKNIDFVTYSNAKINVTLSASEKSLKEQAKAFIDRVSDDLNLINIQEHSAEILVEYKVSLNASNAITKVVERYKQIEVMKARQAEQEARRLAQHQAVKKVDEVIPEPAQTPTPKLETPVIESPEVEEEVTLQFKVTATKSKLRELKNWLIERGYKYE